jgi:hypothetical protein
MKFIQDNGEIEIILDGADEERAVLRAIVKASFELASPAGLSVVDYVPEHQLNDAEADQWIRTVPRSHDNRVVDIDFIQGRQCKTVVAKEACGRFVLDLPYFERYRGSCFPMLQRARELVGQTKSSSAEDRLNARSVNLRVLSATT